jgi:nitronate monooxygenase
MGVGIVFTSGHDPSAHVERLKAEGILWTHVVPAIRYAEKAQRLGADAVVLVGFEAGGHPGLDDVALSVLIRLARARLSVPVMAAGGISDGESLLAALAWGADGVQVGTRFVLSAESGLHPALKQMLLDAGERDTVIIERSLRRARRVLGTSPAREVLRLEAEGAGFEELRHIIGGKAYLETVLEGRSDRGVLSTGQNVGLLEDVPSAGEVVKDMIDGALGGLRRLEAMRDR